MPHTTTPASAAPTVVTTSGCLFYHPKNEEERAEIWANFENARATADPVNMMVALCQLKPCKCGYQPPAGADIPADDTTVETAASMPA